jgi:hypothetical protein
MAVAGQTFSYTDADDKRPRIQSQIRLRRTTGGARRRSLAPDPDGHQHGENVEHDERFETPAKAQDAALTLARRHIYEQHNDTLMARNTLS